MSNMYLSTYIYIREYKMYAVLHTKWTAPWCSAHVLYDRPPAFFKRLSVAEAHEVLRTHRTTTTFGCRRLVSVLNYN